MPHSLAEKSCIFSLTVPELIFDFPKKDSIHYYIESFFAPQ
jgi:hypothetical protein